jgi:acyl-CoA synthetase (AMP-forming)/AMP-acid ligase II
VSLLPPARRAGAVTFAHALARFGEATALVADGAPVTYADLDRRVQALTDRLSTGSRRLVAVEAGPTAAFVVGYLAALRGDHPVLVVPPGADRLIERYDVDVVIRNGTVTERRSDRAHELHPDLALLLSTSGSTGSPKVVRLSATNVEANTASIVDYLDLTRDERAITSLPFAYCYGLSVLHTHLAVGASIVLSDRSVIDPGFWRDVRRHRVTSFAAVPHTFELLDRLGFADLHLPSLRTITQAGGRLAPDTVRRYAELGRRRGFDLVVMYGQTEATARMAYLPPALTLEAPGAIGRPVPGGELRLDDVDEAGVGELVYRGPNVMLGYAEGPADLALGRTVEELRTGDLARVDDRGLFEIVGRRARFVKPFGLRVDLDELERLLAGEGVDALCAGDDRHVVVAARQASAAPVAALVQRRVGLPPAAIAVHRVDELPRLANGKPDHAAVLALGSSPALRSAPGSVHRLFTAALGGVDVGDDDTFASLGGDSLSYVELSLALEEAIGTLPEDWPALTVGELEHRRRGTTRPTRTAAVETTVVLRAAAITMIVATHAALTDLKGGAHVLLAVAGWNFARFQLPVAGRRLATAIARVAVPTSTWIALVAVLFGGAYSLTNVLLVHTLVGEAVWSERWRFWFVEALVVALAAAGVGLAIPAVRRLERRRPFELAGGVLAATLALRAVAASDATVRRPQEVVWCFALGWAAQRAGSTWQKAIVSVVVLAAVPGFFGQPLREAVVVAGLLLLVWVRTLPVVRPVHRVAGALAAASLTIYLTHWSVYPEVRAATASPALATVAALALGLAAHAGVRRVRRIGPIGR